MRAKRRHDLNRLLDKPGPEPIFAIQFCVVFFILMLDALFEWVAKFLIEVVFYTVFYGIGWVMLRAVTFGRYPPAPPRKHNEELVALFPIATLGVALTVAFS